MGLCITPPNAGGTQYLYSSDAYPVGELLNWRVQKLTLRPGRLTTTSAQ